MRAAPTFLIALAIACLCAIAWATEPYRPLEREHNALFRRHLSQSQGPDHLTGDASHIGKSCSTGGSCRWSDDCTGEQLTGECPGSTKVKCCVPKSPDHLTGDASHIGKSCSSGGECKWSDDCTGEQLTGKCPGSTKVKCCVPKSPDHLTGDASHIGKSCSSGGKCRWSDDCSGEQLTGKCPGSTKVKCCVPKKSETGKKKETSEKKEGKGTHPCDYCDKGCGLLPPDVGCIAKRQACKGWQRAFQGVVAPIEGACNVWPNRSDGLDLVDEASEELIKKGYFTKSEFEGVTFQICGATGIFAAGMAPSPNKILLKPKFRNDDLASRASLVAHEMCHIRQWRRWGAGGFRCRYQNSVANGDGTGRDNAVEKECYDFQDSLKLD